MNLQTDVGIFGSLHASLFSETIAPSGVPFDTAHIVHVARSHEAAGFDGVLLPFSATAPDNILTLAVAATATKRLRFFLSHRPGFTAPTLAARQLATLDQLTGGRLILHLIAGSRNAEQQRDGDYLDHDDRYRRLEEYLAILQSLWANALPLDHSGEFYKFQQALSSVKPVQKHLPVSIGGVSEPALAVASRHADIFPIWAETLDGVAEVIGKLRQRLPGNRAPPRFALSLRVIIGRTEAEAWDLARGASARAEHVRLWEKRDRHNAAEPPENEGSRRQLALVDKGEVLDERLYTGLAKATGAPGSTTVVVGTAEQVANALLKYRAIGISDFLFRGLDPRTDAETYGRKLIPLLREKSVQSSDVADTSQHLRAGSARSSQFRN